MQTDASYRTLLVESADGIGVVTLNRPERRNALSLETMHELIAAFESFAADRSVKVLILRGVGPAFSAGHDLREMLARSVDEYRRTFDVCVRLMETIQAIPQPVIAEVAGIATAAGCQLVATCDLAVAASTARFATPGVKIGLFCTTPMVPLVRTIAPRAALEMLLTGKAISAQQALAWGLVNRVIPADQLDAAVQEFTDAIRSSSPLTVRIGKEAFYDQLAIDEASAYERATEVMTKNALCRDAQEGMSAFVHKRRPVWTGQ
jgi:enoyl-CoA hydratase/carnithine racemase